jgi:uroporphyrinogen III methyltransferase/synthase
MSTSSSPIFGKRVLVTRPAHQNEEFALALRALGAEPILAPVIELLPPDDRAAAEQAVHHASEYPWIVFTSANGVRAFFDQLTARREDARALGSAKIAAIGIKTSQALLHYRVYADLVPQSYVAEDLADALVAASKPGDRILIYRAQEARDVLPQRLSDSGRVATIVAAYKTVYTKDLQFAEKVALADILTFTSSSTVRGFVHNLGGEAAAVRAASGKTVACIGPITAESAHEAGLHVDAVANEYTAAGLVDALARRIASA